MPQRSAQKHLLVDRGFCFLLCDDYPRALADFDRIAKEGVSFADKSQRAGALIAKMACELRAGSATAVARCRKPLLALPTDRWTLRHIQDAWCEFAINACTRAVALWHEDQRQEAVRKVRWAADAFPKFWTAQAVLAWFLTLSAAPCSRDSREAVKRARKACRQFKEPGHALLSVLAAALAFSGDYAGAAAVQAEAIELAEGAGGEEPWYLLEMAQRWLARANFFGPAPDGWTEQVNYLAIYRRRLQRYKAGKALL